MAGDEGQRIGPGRRWRAVVWIFLCSLLVALGWLAAQPADPGWWDHVNRILSIGLVCLGGGMIVARLRATDRSREEGNARLATIVRSSADAVFAKDNEGRITTWNPGAEAMYGYAAEEVISSPVTILFPPDLHGQIDETLAMVRRGHVASRHTWCQTKSGRIIDVNFTVSPIRNRHGQVVGASTIARDMTNQHKTERLMLELNMALSHAMPGIATVDRDGLLETANESFRTLTSKKAAELVGQSWLELMDADGRDTAQSTLEDMLHEGCAEMVARSSASEEQQLKFFLVRRLDSQTRFCGFHLFLRDVTDQLRGETEVRKLVADLAEANRKLERQAHIDPLTGLLNRRGLERQLRRLHTGWMGKAQQAAVIQVDIDDFKEVNSRHGHAGGDRVLVSIAQALDEGARASDRVARIGGDEFLLVLPNTRLGEAALIAERLRAVIADESVMLGDYELWVTCSFGVASVASGTTTVEELEEAVRIEFSESKTRGKNRVCAGGESTETTPLNDILAGRGLRAVHQPIYDLVENRIVAFELLSRGPRGRYERPQVFLNLLHPGEGLGRLDMACLRACVEAAMRLPKHVCLHCNLFPSTLISLGADPVVRELRRAGPGRVFCIELNERDIPGDSLELQDTVRALKSAGIQVAIDDVGYGSTSLEALVHLEPDVIKIDRSCVCDAASCESLERFLSVANALHARVVVEGVEDRQTLERLLAMRVRYGQGYLWGRPEPPSLSESDTPWPQKAIQATTA